MRYISDTVRSEVVTITPQLAAKLLEQNTGNRKVSKTNYDSILESMRSGEWVLNGESIKISKNGRILDGQHRLMAAAENDLTFETFVTYGLPESTQDTMDTGKSRNAADVLSINGYSSPNELASITSGIIRSERWNLKAAFHGGAGYPVTPKQVLDRVQAEPTLVDLTQLSVSVRKKVPLTAKICGILYYRFSAISQEDADYFFEKLANGYSLERGNPILALRDTLFKMKNANSNKGTRNQVLVSALVVKAWNKFRDGSECLSLRFTPGGANPEKYPEPH